MNNFSKDPYNIIITGVGGQGNVTASRILGDILAQKYVVTTGETFGASQRGGAVMSHLRVSSTLVWSPQIPRGKADCVIALEPVEAIRVIKEYGNITTRVILNTRPVYPVNGGRGYPSLEDIKKTLKGLTDYVWCIDATDIALHTLGIPIMGNMVMVGAVAGLNILPLEKKDFAQAISNHFPENVYKLNLKAFELGIESICGKK
jgi:indolepyruvate ferredoxin oxidoreductase beta subunit